PRRTSRHSRWAAERPSAHIPTIPDDARGTRPTIPAFRNARESASPYVRTPPRAKNRAFRCLLLLPRRGHRHAAGEPRRRRWRTMGRMDEPAYYELLELLGEGGMGRVYRTAHHPSGQVVAIKVLRSELRRDRLRRRLLLDEATAAAKLDHPSIVRLLDLGRDEGGPLDALGTRWAGFRRIGRVLREVAEGLTAAHAAGIVHRDLKLANVIVSAASDGTPASLGRERARILDFGVAALVDPLRDPRESAVARASDS